MYLSRYRLYCALHNFLIAFSFIWTSWPYSVSANITKIVGISNRHCLEGLWFEFRQGKEIFCSLKLFGQALGLFGLLFNEYRGSFPAVKCSGSEVDQPPLRSAEHTNGWRYTSIALHAIWRGQRPNLHFTSCNLLHSLAAAPYQGLNIRLRIPVWNILCLLPSLVGQSFYTRINRRL
jgi:hypothetical protein